MKITAKRGFEMDVEVSGYSDRPEIKVSFNFGGKNMRNENAKIVRNGKIAEGISLPRLNGMVECPVAEIELAISHLPKLVKMYRKEARGLDADGDIVVVEKWYRDGFEVDSRFMTEYLNSLNVTEIDVETADAGYEASRKVAESKTKIENIVFDNESEAIYKFNGIEVDKFAMFETVGETKEESENGVEKENIVVDDAEVAKAFLEEFRTWTGNDLDHSTDIDEIVQNLPITITEDYMYMFGTDEYGNDRDIIIAGMSRNDFEASIESLKEISPTGWEIVEE